MGVEEGGINRVQKLKNEIKEMNKLIAEIEPEKGGLPFEFLLPQWFRDWDSLPENTKSEKAKSITKKQFKMYISMLEEIKESLIHTKKMVDKTKKR
jgi:uncharacterized protein (UPF0335 family)